MKHFYLLLLFFTLLLNAQDYKLTLKRSNITIDRGSFLFTTEQNLSLEAIQSMPFQPTTLPRSFGYAPHKDLWLKITLHNATSTDAHIGINNVHGNVLSNAHYYLLEDGIVVHETSLARNRYLPSISHYVPLLLEANKTYTLYIKQNSINAQLANFKIQTHTQYHKHKTRINFFFGLFFGAMFALLIYHLFIYLNVSSSLYSYYLFLILFVTLFTLFATHMLAYISSEIVNTADITNAFALLGVLFLALFTQHILETKKYTPFSHKMLTLLSFFSLLFVITLLLIGGEMIIALVAKYMLIVMVIVFMVALRALQRKVPLAKLYVTAVGLNLLSIMVTLFLLFGIAPYNTVTVTAQYIGPLIEIIIFSSILSYRIKQLQQEALEKEQRLKEEITNRNAILETQVATALQELRQKDEAMLRQSRLAQIGDMISMIAHQWRQPLSVITAQVGNLEISQEFDALDDKTLSEGLGLIAQTAKELSATINQFKSFFRSDESLKATTLEHITRTAVAIIEPTLREHKINIVFEINNSDTIFQYESELTQVVLNLLKNAQEAIVATSKEYGTITLSIYTQEKMYHLMICDNGIGIDHSIQSKIFDPYFTTKEERNGAGIGLYTTKMIVEQKAKGRISCSNAEIGSCFTITLPSLEESDTTSEPSL